MKKCKNYLEILASQLDLNKKIQEEHRAHIEECNKCFQRTSIVQAALLNSSDFDHKLSEENITNLLYCDYSDKLEETFIPIIEKLLSSEQGLNYAIELAKYHYAPYTVPASAQKMADSKLKEIMAEEESVIATYIINAKNKAGEIISNIKETTEELLYSVLNPPILEPAMASLRADLYDNAKLQENQTSLKLPYYFDGGDTLLNVLVKFSNNKMEISYSLIKEEEKIEIKEVIINGSKVNNGNIEIELQDDILITVKDENLKEYTANIVIS